MNSYVLYISICLYLSLYSHSLQGDKGNDQMPPGELVFIGELWNGAEGARDSVRALDNQSREQRVV